MSETTNTAERAARRLAEKMHTAWINSSNPHKAIDGMAAALLDAGLRDLFLAAASMREAIITHSALQERIACHLHSEALARLCGEKEGT